MITDDANHDSHDAITPLLSVGIGSSALDEDDGCREDLLTRQEAVVALGRRSIAPPDLAVLVQDAAALMATMLDLEHSGVAEFTADDSGLEIKLRLGKTETEEPGAAIHQVGFGGNESLAGHALELAHPVIVENLALEKRFQEKTLRKHGFTSAVAVPLVRPEMLATDQEPLEEGQRAEKHRITAPPERAFGVLLAGSRGARHFDPEDVLFAETIAHLVGSTLARALAERSLAQQRRVHLGMMETVDALVLLLSPQGHIMQINRAGRQMTGFSPEEIQGRPIGSVFPVRFEEGLFEAIFEKLAQGVSPVHYESYLLTKHSQKRRVAWSYAAVTDSNGTIQSIIATGIDLTRQREAEERAAKAEHTVERACEEYNKKLAAPEKSFPEVGPVGSGTHGERRNRVRRSYPYRQWIAPILDGKLPALSEFVEMECNDIGVGGFSFLSSGPPASDRLVVALGTSSNSTYMIAEVAHVTRVERDQQRQYLIGCSYSGRAPY